MKKRGFLYKIKIETKSSERVRTDLAARDFATSRLDFVDLRDFLTISTFVIRVLREAGQPSSLNRVSFPSFQSDNCQLSIVN